MSEDDSELFRDFVGDVAPLKKVNRAELDSSQAITPGMRFSRQRLQNERNAGLNPLASVDVIKPVKPWDELSYKRDGVQHGVFKNLRLGKYAVEARLDLHHQTVEQARISIMQLVKDCMAHNIRCALITHGKGEQREKPALLKSCVNHWLRELDEVLAFHSAQRHHGGFGATYVLFRKSAEKREENKEIFSKRRG